MDQVNAEVAENKFVLVAAMSDRASEAGAAYTAAASGQSAFLGSVGCSMSNTDIPPFCRDIY